MSRKTLADVFIKTLTEMWEADCESRLVRERLQSKVRTERFLGAFRAKLGHSAHHGTHHRLNHGHRHGQPAE
jgi:hypothetical protein